MVPMGLTFGNNTIVEGRAVVPLTRQDGRRWSEDAIQELEC